MALLIHYTEFLQKSKLYIARKKGENFELERQKTPKAKKMKYFFIKTLVKTEKTGYSLYA